MNLWINGGYFIFRNEIFDYIKDGNELVLDPFSRLIENRQLMAYKYEGFLARHGYAPRPPSARRNGRAWRNAMAHPAEHFGQRDNMRSLRLAAPGERLKVLCLGAHSDDIEIGAGAALMTLIEHDIRLDVHWCVLSSAGGEREREARVSAADFLKDAAQSLIEVMDVS